MCKNIDIPFWRQLFVLSSSLFCDVSRGIVMSFPGVLNTDILSATPTTIKATSDEASWIATCNGLSGIVGFLIIPFLAEVWGRRPIHIFLNTILMTGWITMYFANSVSALVVARVIQGLDIGGMMTARLIIAEYSHPKRRGYFLNIGGLTAYVGILLCHVLASSWGWRNIALLAAFTNLAGLVLTCFWPESPAFLAVKGRFEECKRSYVWLHGRSGDLTEMNELIKSQQDRIARKEKGGKNVVDTLRKSTRKMFKRDFAKACFIAIFLTVVIDASGRYLFITYIIQIMTELVKNKSVAVYFSIGSDCVTLLAVAISCFVIRLFKRRTILFGATSISVFLMFSTSICLVLKARYGFLTGSPWFLPIVIILQSFVANMAVIPVCYTLIGEIFFLEYAGIGACASGVATTAIYALDLKISPLLLASVGVEGVYGICGLCVVICLIALYFLIVETKDRTLLEISNDMKGVRSTPLEQDVLLVKERV